jgi:hypothetical protein
MFWGYPDVSVSFCEDKYVVSDYIAEYYNTMSALSYVIVGLLFYKTRLKNLSLILISLGLGTALMHSTLRYYGQWLDELSMLVLSFYIIKEIKRLRFKKIISDFYLLLLILPYFTFEGYFCYFFLVFISLQVYTYIIVQKDYKDYSKGEYLLVKGYSGVLIFSSLCWVTDQLFCESVRNYQLHAVWHVGTALSILMGLTALLIK